MGDESTHRGVGPAVGAADALPLVAVTHDAASQPLLTLAPHLTALCRVLWLVDAGAPGMARAVRLLRKFGTVLDIGGLDPEQTAAQVGAFGPAGLISYSDGQLPAMADLAQRLGLAFHSPATAHMLVDKDAQRAGLRAAGLQVPDWWSVGSGPLAETFDPVARDVSWPAVLKPRSGAGSRDVYLAPSAGYARGILADLGEDREPMLIETYLADDPSLHSAHFASFVSVETVVSAGHATHLAVTGRLALAAPFRESGSFIPAALAPADQRAVLAVTDAAIAALAITDSCVHTEVKLTPDGPRVLEVNGRIGGGVPEMLERATGVDIVALSVAVALGRDLNVADLPPCSCVAYHFFVQPTQTIGTVESIDGLAAIAEVDGVSEVVAQKGPGDAVDWRVGTRSVLVEIGGTTASHSGLEALDTLIHDELSVSYGPTTADADASLLARGA